MLYPGIRTRITLPYLLAIAVTAAIGVFIVTQLVAGSVQERFNNQLLDSAQAASNTVADVERQQLATLRLMVFTEGIASAVEESDTETLNRLLRPVAVNARADDVIVFNTDGESLYRLQRLSGEEGIAYQTTTPPDIAGREGVRRILSGESDALGDKFVEIVEEGEQIFLYINAPIINDDNQLVGGISLGMAADHFAERVGEQSLSAVTLYQENGNTLGSTFRTVEINSLDLPPEEVEQILEETDEFSPIYRHEIAGTAYQTLYTPLQIRSQRVGLLAVSLSSGFIVERISTSRNYIAVLFAALFGIIALLGLIIARSIINPVTRLVETTRAIRSGDLSRRVQLKTPDELGELGISFDHMTDQLVQRNREMNAVLTSISDAVIVQDFSGRILLHNPTADKLLGQITGLLKSPEQLAEPRTISLGAQFFSALSTPVRMDDNSLLGHVIVLREITALIQAEQLKDELMKQLSHELRTPLSAARGYLELGIMLGQPEHLNNSLNSMNILERLINQVIDVSVMLSGQLSLEIDTFDLQEIIQEQVATWTPLYEKRDLSLTYNTPSAVVEIQGDRQRLVQVIDHLLRNSYSYTLPGGKIDVTLNRIQNEVTITVQDTGVGIAEHELEKVFERLYRGESADAGPTDTRGLGLGLYFSKRIVEAHHGTIALHSQRNVGTTVTIHLPLDNHAN